MPSLKPGHTKFDLFFQSAPPEIDRDALLRVWQGLKPPYIVSARKPPVPLWARRSFSENGEEAWSVLQHELVAGDLTRGLCLYIHIPFCTEKCSFCDCYSFRLRAHVSEQVHRYLDALEREIDVWSSLGVISQRPVSTIHWGGGTPLFLDECSFQRLAGALRHHFQAGQETEWALETTSSAFTPEAAGMLSNLGFTRIHIGVQSLSDPIRKTINRRESSQAVLEKIARAVSQGWVISVDLIYGLPHQSLEDFLNDIRLLAQTGVDGFSLYPLQISSRNRAILQSYGPSGKNLVREFWMLQAGEQLLNHLGYRKTLFNHFAREKDTNLYFTFPERGEDCLALGTIADGVFGDYHYRHLEYRDYLLGTSRDSTKNFPGLQGGVRRSAVENRIFPLEIAVLSGRVRYSQFVRVLGGPTTDLLLEDWLTSGLLHGDPSDSDNFWLTAAGSWFSGLLINQLTSFACPAAS